MIRAASRRFEDVTEAPGLPVTRIQLARDVHRYAIAAAHSRGKDVLDAACGTGQGLGLLASEARSVVGGDYTPAHVAIARRHYGSRVPLLELDAQALPFQDGSFDTVTLLEAIYYLPEPRRFLRECRRVLRRPGTLVISSVNRAWPDFGPSPLSLRYYDAGETATLLGEEGFSVEMFGAFPDDTSAAARVRSLVRRTAVKLNLLPGSLRAKATLKRFFYGPLLHQPAELSAAGSPAQPLLPIDPGVPETRCSILYAVARL